MNQMADTQNPEIPDAAAAPVAEHVPAAAGKKSFKDGVRLRLRAWSQSRIVGLDVARALAIIGMMAAHLASAPELVWGDPSTWFGVVHGRSSILFAVIAGISVALLTPGIMTADAETVRQQRLRLVGRAGVIFVIGLVLELVSSGIAVILAVYGALFVMAIPFLRWSRKKLLIVAGLIAVVGTALRLVFVRYGIGYGSGTSLMFYGTYPALEWIVFLMVGLAIGRTTLTSLKTAVKLVGVGALAAVIGYGTPALFETVQPAEHVKTSSSELEPVMVDINDIDTGSLTCETWGGNTTCYTYTEKTNDDSTSTESEGDTQNRYLRFLVMVLEDSPHSGGLGEIVGSGGFAIFVIGLSLIVGRARWFVMPLAAMGSMPLTVYTVHVLSAEILFRKGLDSGFTWALSVVGLMLAAWLWMVLLGKGPFERLSVWGARRLGGTVESSTGSGMEVSAPKS